MTSMRKIIFMLQAIFFMGACAAPTAGASATTTAIPSIQSPTATVAPLPTETPIPPTPTTDYIEQVCSPLDGIELNELTGIITQPYKTPHPKNDDGHHGVDFAFYRFNDLVGIEGVPIAASLPGEVVTVLIDKNPYGYAVIIETPLKKLDPALLAKLALPEIQPTVIPDPRVNCPPNGELSFTLSESDRSLYLLYGHMKEMPLVKVGDIVTCGQQLGYVGNTGQSSNAHLHFEARVGPSGARFESMAYYTVQSTEAERYNYCVWRVSNRFELLDPMILLSVQN
jgi:murein DD-endopeptidase MepM/ murein hydrolase activator NlpD